MTKSLVDQNLKQWRKIFCCYKTFTTIDKNDETKPHKYRRRPWTSIAITREHKKILIYSLSSFPYSKYSTGESVQCYNWGNSGVCYCICDIIPCSVCFERVLPIIARRTVFSLALMWQFTLGWDKIIQFGKLSSVTHFMTCLMVFHMEVLWPN